MIQMTSGYTCWNDRLIGPNDGPVDMSEAVEARLVGLGVAKYVPDPAEEAPLAPLAAPGADFRPGKGADPAAPERAAEAATEGIEALNEPQEEIRAEDLSFAQLKAAAEQMGIETRGLRSKAALIAAIESAKPPDLQVMS